MQDNCITIDLRLPEMEVVRERETETEIVVEVRYRATGAWCPRCGQRTPKVHAIQLQHKRDMRLWEKPVSLVLHKRRFRCMGCQKVFTEPDPVFGIRRRTSQRFRHFLGKEALEQPVSHVARREGVGDGLVRRCFTEAARRLLDVAANPPPPTVLGLDEFSVRKRRVYDTAIVDIERKWVLGVVGGHKCEDVQKFLESLPYPELVKVAVMDMYEPFRQAVEMCLPEAKIVVDKFHVMMHVHQALDRVRAGIEPESGARLRLFRSRYLLLKGAERLTMEQQAKLTKLLRSYPVLQRAWALKEALRFWYGSSSRQEAEHTLAIWEKTVRQDGPEPFRALLSMFRTWREPILNYFDHRFTNGFLEGKNNRIKVIKRVAYGYRNSQNFRHRILLTNLKELAPKAA